MLAYDGAGGGFGGTRRRAKESYEVLTECPYAAPRQLYVLTSYDPAEAEDAGLVFLRTRKPKSKLEQVTPVL
eukprot:626549-Prorocentrum_minimum.AAC.1